MDTMERIIGYLTETYHPQAIILYGSYADDSANENSDFDALVIAGHAEKHDAAVIGQTVLDVFVYPPAYFRKDFDPAAFVQIYDGKIVLDRDGTAERLRQKVRDSVDHRPPKTDEEIRQEVGWCEKMLSRTVRGDAEGYYRWHWLLLDSLEIYCDIRHRFYFGPKKTLRRMEQTDAEAFRIYTRALKEMNREYLSEWTEYLKCQTESRAK